MMDDWLWENLCLVMYVNNSNMPWFTNTFGLTMILIITDMVQTSLQLISLCINSRMKICESVNQNSLLSEINLMIFDKQMKLFEQLYVVFVSQLILSHASLFLIKSKLKCLNISNNIETYTKLCKIQLWIAKFGFILDYFPLLYSGNGWYVHY